MVVTGRSAMIAAVAAVIVMVVLPSWVGVVAMTALLAVLIVIDASASARGSDLELLRADLTTVRVGHEAAVELTVTNRGRRTVRAMLWDDWPDSVRADRRTHRLNLGPNTRTRLVTAMTPTGRGDRVAGPVTIRLLGPLGLAGRQIRRQAPARVRALPPFRSERILASKVRQLQQLEGRNVVNIRGQGAEFDSFREYVAGDDVRAIDWRATARASDVLVRTWRPERNRHVLVLLDTGRYSAGLVGGGASGSAEATRLETSIEAALLLSGLAASAGDTVALLAYDRQVRAEVRTGSGQGLQPKLMHALAGIVPALVDTDTEGMVRAAVQRTRRRSLVVWFTGLDGAMVEENLLPVLPVLARRHRVLLVSVTDPDIATAATHRTTTPEIYTAAAAENLLAERALVQESLRRKGIDVVATSPDRLPEALADEYLELKKSGAM
ncbi:DUF58 domain-containing protein [Nocardia jiangxiensis]|uniref:DUF58 domain-containing protein n=1 Tax=Nocardia jiangxiensis TaxID=282685 RepID=A0ABW6RWA2_9NOCA|nr:DUF58 domain-containing protein [Nocardia jiangxiensis]